MTDLTVTVSKVIHADQETTFNAWLDPAMLSSFILPKPGMPAPEVTNDPVTGGKFEIIMQVGDSRIPHHGVYNIIDPPRCLEFTWNSPFSAADSVVRIEFDGVGVNETKVTLVHTRFPDLQSRDNHEGGWRNILDSLGTCVEIQPG
jgi:uncharacterized protein YndB with AHSA1/START domain